jgi:hypothetical protein
MMGEAALICLLLSVVAFLFGHYFREEDGEPRYGYAIVFMILTIACGLSWLLF